MRYPVPQWVPFVILYSPHDSFCECGWSTKWWCHISNTAYTEDSVFAITSHSKVLFLLACFERGWTWWRHPMETFSASLALCAGNSPIIGEFPPQKPVTRTFAVFFDRRLNERLSKQSWGWWFETPSRPLWRHNNDQAVVSRKVRYRINVC